MEKEYLEHYIRYSPEALLANSESLSEAEISERVARYVMVRSFEFMMTYEEDAPMNTGLQGPEERALRIARKEPPHSGSLYRIISKVRRDMYGDTNGFDKNDFVDRATELGVIDDLYPARKPRKGRNGKRSDIIKPEATIPHFIQPMQHLGETGTLVDRKWNLEPPQEGSDAVTDYNIRIVFLK